MEASQWEYSFRHPQLGFLTGRLQTPQTAHFRSIPFARIPGRFRRSTIITEFDEKDNRNFTTYGTACPQIGHTDDKAIGGAIPGYSPRDFAYDEFSCLNLTIAAPVRGLDANSGNGGIKLVPVMVYVHGGAFKEGMGNISSLHDATGLVEMSIQENHPVVIVNIHYRVNWLGFLACQDLIDEALESGIPCNFGIQDLRNAFLWIKHHISGFGGDPSQVTAFGESAGSAGISMLMCSDVPLFNRAILMSGSPATGPPVELKYKEAEYMALLKYLEIDYSDPERLQKLRNVPISRLVDAIDGVGIVIFSALREERLFPRGSPNWWNQDEIIGGCEWVDSVIIGDCFYEGFLYVDAFKGVPLEEFMLQSYKLLGEVNATKIFNAYGISAGMDPNLFWTKLMFLMGDVAFSEPSHKLATKLASVPQKISKQVYRYTLTLRNPFPGSPYHQIPGHHFIDVLFLFGTLQFRYPMQRQRDLSTEFMKRWLLFGTGQEPWDQHVIDGSNEEGKIMVVDGLNSWDIRTKKEDERKSKLSEEGPRRYQNWQVIAEVMNDIGKDHIKNGVEARMSWGTDGGIFRWALPKESPVGIVLP